MTKRERSSRPGRPSRERSPDALLDRSWPDRGLRDSDFLDPGWPDPGWPDPGWPTSQTRAGQTGVLRRTVTPPAVAPVAQVLAALTSAPESSELTGQARVLAEFRAFAESGTVAEAPAPGADLPSPAPHRDPGRMTWLPGGRLAVAAATGAVLMGGLLAVAYAGDLPVAAQRLAHDTIHAPAVGPDRNPAVSSPPTGSPNSAGPAGHQATHALVGPDRKVGSGSVSGHPHRHGSSSSSPGSSSGRLGSGRQGQSGPRPCRALADPDRRPRRVSAPRPPTPSPSATPSPTRPAEPVQRRRAFPPDRPPPPVAAAGAVRRAGSQPPRGLGPSHTSSDVTQISG